MRLTVGAPLRCSVDLHSQPCNKFAYRGAEAAAVATTATQQRALPQHPRLRSPAHFRTAHTRAQPATARSSPAAPSPVPTTSCSTSPLCTFSLACLQASSQTSRSVARRAPGVPKPHHGGLTRPGFMRVLPVGTCVFYQCLHAQPPCAQTVPCLIGETSAHPYLHAAVEMERPGTHRAQGDQHSPGGHAAVRWRPRPGLGTWQAACILPAGKQHTPHTARSPRHSTGAVRIHTLATVYTLPAPVCTRTPRSTHTSFHLTAATVRYLAPNPRT